MPAIQEMQRGRFDPCVRKISCRRKWQPNSSNIVRKISTVHGVTKASDTTEQPNNNKIGYFMFRNSTCMIPNKVLHIVIDTLSIM